MLIRILLCLFVFICWKPPIAAQDAVLDSIKQVVDTMTIGKEKVETLISISVQLYSGRESKQYAYQAINIASELKDELLLADSYNNLASIFQIENHIDSFDVFSSLAEEKYRVLKDNWGLAAVYRSRATVFTNFGQEEFAIENFQKALDFGKKAKHARSIINTLNNWGIFYFKNGNYAASIAKLEEALSEYESGELSNRNIISRLEFNLGRSLQAAKKYNESLFYFKSAYLKRKEMNLVGGIGESRNQLLELWLDLQNNKQDLTAFNNTLNELGYSNGYEVLDALQKMAFDNNHSGIKKMYLQTSTKIYENSNNYQLALANFKKLKILEDSLILNEQNISTVADIKMKYNNEVLQNQLLKAQILEAKSTNQRNLLMTALIASLMLAGIGGLYFNQKMNVKKLALELEAKKLEDLQKKQQLIAMKAMLEGQEKERERIAKDLHDGLGNMLSTIKHQVAGLSLSLVTQEAIKNKAELMIDEACAEVRKIAHNMMPRALKRLGLNKALKDLCERQETQQEYEVIYQCFGQDYRLDANVATMLYRIAQEIFNNINKHALAKEVVVQITYGDEWLNLGIEDDGKGFDLNQVMLKEGLGLHSIQSRVSYLSGEFLIDSRPNNGTSISINIPKNKSLSK